MKAKRACLYLRVSTATKSQHGEALTFDQDPAVQEQPLRELVAQRGWTVTNVYSDGVSGAKEWRPRLDALMTDARRGAFDAVVVWRFEVRPQRPSTGPRPGRVSRAGHRFRFPPGGLDTSRR